MDGTTPEKPEYIAEGCNVYTTKQVLVQQRTFVCTATTRDEAKIIRDAMNQYEGL